MVVALNNLNTLQTPVKETAPHTLSLFCRKVGALALREIKAFAVIFAAVCAGFFLSRSCGFAVNGLPYSLCMGFVLGIFEGTACAWGIYPWAPTNVIPLSK